MKQIAFRDMMQIMMQSHKDIHSLNSAKHQRYATALPKNKEDIRNIIDSMINIQAVLARHYVYKRDFGFTRSTDSTYFMTEDVERELEMFATVFDEVIVSKRFDGIPINIQVSNANELAYQTFADMIIDNKVDSHIRHLTIERPFVQDVSHNTYFEIDRVEGEIVKNKYYDYLINGSLSSYMINPMYIDVSGFRINEIENDVYVRQLGSQVKHLFLMVFKQETHDITFYSKHLRWYV